MGKKRGEGGAKKAVPHPAARHIFSIALQGGAGKEGKGKHARIVRVGVNPEKGGKKRGEKGAADVDRYVLVLHIRHRKKKEKKRKKGGREADLPRPRSQISLERNNAPKKKRKGKKGGESVSPSPSPPNLLFVD